MAPVVQPSTASLDRPFRLGGCEIDPATGDVRNGDQVTRLQPQAVEVLRYLASRPGRVVSRDEIEDSIWNDRTVGYDSLTGTMFKLRKAFGDDSKSPRIIETVSRRGYRLLVAPEPVGRSDVQQGTWAPAQTPSRPVGRRLLSGKRLAAALAVPVLTAAVVVWWLGTVESRDSRVDGGTQRALVVLPFESLDDASKHDQAADALTDDLTTALARVPGLVVIARDSAFLYKTNQPTLQEIAARLRADLALRGSVRQMQGHVRINAQLIDLAKGSHIWGERLEAPAAQIFDLEDRIVQKVADIATGRTNGTTVHTRLVARTRNPEAYRAFQLGRQLFYLYLSKRENSKARALFADALRHDPKFAVARAMLAWTYAFDAMHGWSDDRDASLRLAGDEARKAMAANPELPLAYFITGLVFREQGEYVKALVEAEKAIRYDPNYANAHVLRATLLYYAGRPEESIAPLKKAMRLNPHHPFNYYFHLGQAYFTLRQYGEAIEELKKGLESNPASERLHVWLAAAFAQAGKFEDAQWEAEQVRINNPQFSLTRVATLYPFKSKSDHDRLVEGLRKAGLR